MKKIVHTLAAVAVFALAYWIAWEAAAPQSAPVIAPSESSKALPVNPQVPVAAAIVAPTIRKDTDLSDEQTEGIASGTQPAIHFLSRATADEAAQFLRGLIDQENAQPGSASSQLAPEGVPLSAGVLAVYTEALFPRTQARQFAQGYALTESMEAALRKVFNAEEHAQAAGGALAQRWAEQPTPELRSTIETVNNPWFLAATAAYGQQNGDPQMVQEALARLETTPGTVTASALLDMARQQTASFDDIADTLHHWAARQSNNPDLTARLHDLLVSTEDNDLRALLSVAIAGSGNRQQAETVLAKLAQTSSSSQQPRIQYAQELMRSQP
jgi:hypothetical protein